VSHLYDDEEFWEVPTVVDDGESPADLEVKVHQHPQIMTSEML
jgi:hypothetical protein